MTIVPNITAPAQSKNPHELAELITEGNFGDLAGGGPVLWDSFVSCTGKRGIKLRNKKYLTGRVHNSKKK